MDHHPLLRAEQYARHVHETQAEARRELVRAWRVCGSAILLTIVACAAMAVLA